MARNLRTWMNPQDQCMCCLVDYSAQQTWSKEDRQKHHHGRRRNEPDVIDLLIGIVRRPTSHVLLRNALPLCVTAQTESQQPSLCLQCCAKKYHVLNSMQYSYSHNRDGALLIGKDCPNQIHVVDLSTAGVDRLQQFIHLVVAHLFAQICENVS